MPIPLTCPECKSKLNVPDAFAGKKVKCPKCKTALLAQSAAPVAPAIEIDEEPAEEQDEAPVKRKKFKKKKKKKKSSDIGNTVIWAAGVGGTIVMLGLVGLLFWALEIEVLPYAIGMAISLPFSMGFMLLAMVISSSIAGGIDFGEMKTAIPKVIVILVIMDAVCMIKYAGPWIAAFVLLFGFMGLFGLDFWEARFLVFINWVLNWCFHMFVFALLLKMFGVAGAGGGMPSMFDTHDKDEDYEWNGKRWDYGSIDDMRGKAGVNEKGVFFIDLNGVGVHNDELRALEMFYDKAVELDLSNNPITDKGMKHITNFTNLKKLTLTGTKVTDKGVAYLQKKMPGLQIILEKASPKPDKKGGPNRDKMEPDDDGS